MRTEGGSSVSFCQQYSVQSRGGRNRLFFSFKSRSRSKGKLQVVLLSGDTNVILKVSNSSESVVFEERCKGSTSNRIRKIITLFQIKRHSCVTRCLISSTPNELGRWIQWRQKINLRAPPFIYFSGIWKTRDQPQPGCLLEGGRERTQGTRWMNWQCYLKLIAVKYATP